MRDGGGVVMNDDNNILSAKPSRAKIALGGGGSPLKK